MESPSNGTTVTTSNETPSSNYMSSEKTKDEHIEMRASPEDSDLEKLSYRETNDLGLQQGLKSRHVQFIALAGAIGTGLFVGSGAALSTAGPCPLLLGYIVLSAFVWSILCQLAEMTAYLPQASRATAYALCERYTGNSNLSFTAGINLVYAQALLVPAEISAASFVINYWTDASPAIFIGVLWVVLTVLNFSAVKYFGETEFWIASIKLLTLMGLIIVGVVIFFGGGPAQHHILGFHYWKDPGAFHEYLVPGSTGRFLAVWKSMIKSAFAYILSPELMCCCAAEAEHPRHNLIKASKRFIYRLVFFYIVGSLIIGVIVAYNNDRLMSAVASSSTDAAGSPFVIGIQNAGIGVLDHIVNAAILTSAFSAGNSYMYGATRNLQSMAVNGMVPRLFARCNRYGVPYYSVALCSSLGLLAFLTVSDSASVAFTWLSNISTVSGFVSWIFISITYIRFRKAITAQGLDDRVPYRVRGQYVCAWLCLAFFTLIMLTNGFDYFVHGFQAKSFVAAYITIPIIIVLYVGHAIWSRDFRLFANPEEIDCTTGLEDVEAEAATYVAPKPKNIFERVWFWIA